MLEFLQARAIAGIERVGNNCYTRTFSLDGIQGTVAVQPAAGNALRANIRTTKLSILPQIIARLRRVFDLAADPLSIAAHLATDPTLAPLILQRPGLRIPGAWDGFELAMRAVLGQQITVSGAIRLAGRLVQGYGERLAMPQRDLTHVFPLPQALARAKLAPLGMPASRAATLSAVASEVLADPDLLGARLSLDEAIERLRAIRGIGEWTAQYIALRQLREPDAFPAADIGLQRALADAGGHRPNADELLSRAEKWRPWRAYAAQHLWSSAAQPIRKKPQRAVSVGMRRKSSAVIKGSRRTLTNVPKEVSARPNLRSGLNP
jgi:AraC family transcriptional regulator of adaptative response / DNA-3-methyladenine glycosylase II